MSPPVLVQEKVWGTSPIWGHDYEPCTKPSSLESQTKDKDTGMLLGRYVARGEQQFHCEYV